LLVILPTNCDTLAFKKCKHPLPLYTIRTHAISMCIMISCFGVSRGVIHFHEMARCSARFNTRRLTVDCGTYIRAARPHNGCLLREGFICTRLSNDASHSAGLPSGCTACPRRPSCTRNWDELRNLMWCNSGLSRLLHPECYLRIV
jgi:hypothetical protein